MRFFRTVTFKNVHIFYQNSIVVSETHVYVKASYAISRQRAKRSDKIPHRTASDPQNSGEGLYSLARPWVAQVPSH